MRTLKTRGLDDLEGVHARAKKAYAMGRIDKQDFERINRLINELMAFIIHMRELNEDGEEEG